MSSGSTEEGAPNLTPILDMVFQLITFFMLVINFKTASMDLSLKLPVVGSARPVEGKGQDLLVLNVNTHGELRVMGEKRDVVNYIKQEAAASLMLAQKTRKDAPADDLPTTIVIRADRETPFSLLNKIITSCQENGFRKFSLKAMNKTQEE